jgi:hypothetical protein
VLGRGFVADEPADRVLILHGEQRVAAETLGPVDRPHGPPRFEASLLHRAGWWGPRARGIATLHLTALTNVREVGRHYARVGSRSSQPEPRSHGL